MPASELLTGQRHRQLHACISIPAGQQLCQLNIQITQQTVSDSMAPMWDGWNAGWTDWPYWDGEPYGGPYDWTQFSTRYSGKVIANLQTDSGRRMRCRFHLIQPMQDLISICCHSDEWL